MEKEEENIWRIVILFQCLPGKSGKQRPSKALKS